jgi:SAM-dependent methyltransferase
MSYHKINIGCGKTPTNGFINYDNSISLKMVPFLRLVKLLNKLSVINEEQLSFIEFCKKNKIYYSNAIKKIPLDRSSADVVYASHMLEHLDRDEVKRFLKEAKRVLIEGGIIILVVHDL